MRSLLFYGSAYFVLYASALVLTWEKMAYLPAVGRQLEAVSKLVSLAMGASHFSELNI